MSSKSKHYRSRRADTIIEVVLAILAQSIIALGALSFQYYAATHSKIAAIHMTAARTGVLVIEDWKSTGGSVNYNPEERI